MEYLFMPVSRLIKHHRNAGASMVPCAVDYFVPPKNWIPLGRTGGLFGGKVERLWKNQRGFPIYVWPTSLKVEHDLLNAGLTGLTDCSDPNQTWLPSGHARWNQPASLPLDEVQLSKLREAVHENHIGILKELQSEVVPWMECDMARRKQLVDEWRVKWRWAGTTETLLDGLNDSSPLWEAVRLIGHRGSGKTSRPVFQHHSM